MKMDDQRLLDTIRDSLLESVRIKETISAEMPLSILEAVRLLVSCIESGHKILVMGNGGSASDAQHMASELVGRFERKREGFACIALTTDSSILTAIGNDYGFEEVFSRQVLALASRDDIVVCFSTSGESENVIRAAIAAREKGAKILGFLGSGNSSLAKRVDLPLHIPSTRTCRIQEGHGTLIHVICECLDDHFAGIDRQ